MSEGFGPISLLAEHVTVVPYPGEVQAIPRAAAEAPAASGNDQRRSDCQDGISLFR